MVQKKKKVSLNAYELCANVSAAPYRFNENANTEYYYTHLCCDHATLFFFFLL